VHAFRAPILGAALICLLLCLPLQIIEIYRALAQDLLYADTFRLAPKIRFASGISLCLVCAVSIWTTSRAIARRTPLRASLAKPVIGRLPKVLSALPIAGLAIGIFASSMSKPTIRADDAMRRILAFVFDETIPSVVDVIKDRVLAYNSYLCIAALVAGSIAVAWIVFLPLVDRRSAGRSNATHFAPIELFDWRSRLILYVSAVASTLLFMAMPVVLPQAIGVLGVLFVFAAIVIPIGAHLAFLGDRHGIPYLGIIVSFVLVVSALDLNDNHTLYRPIAKATHRPTAKPTGPPATVSKPPPAEEAFRDWFEKRSLPERQKYRAKERLYPVYVVAAEGGGIYAAFHAASVLGALQDRCPKFADHLFSISGVSGGSLGGATFAAGLKHARESDWPSARSGPCVPTEPPQQRNESMVDFADSLLSSDLLSPLTAGLLFPDMLQKLLIGPVGSLDRTRYFEAALEASEKSAIGRKRNSKVIDFLQSPFLQHWTPSASSPALVVNTTEVGSGRLRIIAPFQFNTDHVLFLPFADAQLAKKAGDSLNNLSVSTAVVSSARFPWVTPAGAFYDWSPETTQSGDRRIEKIRLVDGGYFENSGVASALELISTLQSASHKYGFADQISIRLIVLTRGGFPKQDFFGLSELISPVLALLSARSSRAPLAIDQAERLFRERADSKPVTSISKVDLLDLYYPLPLGWRLSALSTILIQAQNGIPARCRAAGAADQKEMGFDADCLAKTVEKELD
jgi:hypothetical protein